MFFSQIGLQQHPSKTVNVQNMRDGRGNRNTFKNAPETERGALDKYHPVLNWFQLVCDQIVQDHLSFQSSNNVRVAMVFLSVSLYHFFQE